MKGDYAVKEKYIKPQSNVEIFNSQDVITTSGYDEGKRDPIELPDL